MLAVVVWRGPELVALVAAFVTGFALGRKSRRK